ncbi:ABC transporter ATP-binding protein [Salipaludibacillus neizhouensis]|uniref:ABC transporter ATP-binding protein n=1 Tax=Salipaludibacillus neizhouensis TaxID=885475 RepID=A0A3A9K6P1_9BACI|nr:ABC transporter ATP-binding protein [Salipaludibacillus neizhouensis]RKL65991.1 ABC transporter ATP-binding protein [Salipaludibacillus neizhouensis]
MLEVSDLSLGYGKGKGITNIGFQLEPGDRLAVLGANGAGKTTLLKLLGTVLKPSKGKIFLHGQSFSSNLKITRQQIGYVPQDIALFSELTVKQELDFWRGIAPKRIHASKVDEVAGIIGITDLLHRNINELSGGMKRKINLAVALLHGPDVLVMDEPTAGIDIQSKLEIMKFLKSWSEKGKIIILASHDMEEIHYLTDKVLILKHGEKQFFGSVEEMNQSFNGASEALSFSEKVAQLGGW